MARTLRDFIASGLVALIISDMSVVNVGFAVVMHGWESIGFAGNRLRLDSQLRDCLPAAYVRVVGGDLRVEIALIIHRIVSVNLADNYDSFFRTFKRCDWLFSAVIWTKFRKSSELLRSVHQLNVKHQLYG